MCHDKNRWALPVCGLIFLASGGCGKSAPKLYPVAGTVTFEGRAVEGASVLFIPQQGTPSVGVTDAAGKYTLITAGKPGAPEGKYDVTISKSSAGANPAGDEEVPMAQMAGGEPTEADLLKLQDQTTQIGQTMLDAVKADDPPSLLPARYGMPQGSGLSAAVTTDASKNVFDFPLMP